MKPSDYDLPLVVDAPIGATHVVIWMHGLGASGDDFLPILPLLNLPQVRFLFPHAKVRPITVNAGYEMRGWYDIYGFDKLAAQDETGIIESSEYIEHLVQQQIDLGMPAENIWLFGFSQGGAIALYTALMGKHNLGGVVALSTYLPLAEKVIKEAQPQTLPIWLSHGEQDDVIPLALAKTSHDYLKQLTPKIEFTTYPMGHSINEELIKQLKFFLNRQL